MWSTNNKHLAVNYFDPSNFEYKSDRVYKIEGINETLNTYKTNGT